MPEMHIGFATGNDKCIKLAAHMGFAAQPMASCDPRTLFLGDGWDKIAMRHWVSIHEPNALAVHLCGDSGMWILSVRRNAGTMTAFPVPNFPDFEQAVPAALPKASACEPRATIWVMGKTSIPIT